MIKKDNQFPFLISGKIGNLVGRVINGKQFFSKMPGPRKGKPTIRELQVRRNMAIATGFLKKLVPIVKKYDEPNGNTGYHKAMSHILRNAIQGNHPDQRIDYSRVVLGEGSLPNPKKYQVESPAKGLLEFTWSLETMKRKLSKSDRIFAIAYCEATRTFQYEPYGAERRERQFLMDVYDYSGQRMEVYFGFTSLDGELVSTSIYAGSINVL